MNQATHCRAINPTRAALHVLSLLCLLLLFSACQQGGKDENGGPDGPSATAYPETALNYLKESLASPADEAHPALARCWELVARLENLHEDATIREAIGGFVAQNPSNPPYQLVGAWLACEPEAAVPFVAERLKAGDGATAGALLYQPQHADAVFALLDLSTLNANVASTIASLNRLWQGRGSLSVTALQQLAANDEPEAALQAIGYLIAAGQASEEQRSKLITSLESTDIRVLAAAVEGVRFSGDPALADKLVPLVANAELGAESPPEAGQRDLREVYGSYALAWLPGPQAELMRDNLLGARDPMLRWNARLGELLAGDPEPWLNALLTDGAEQHEMWVSLEPPEAVNDDLLITYEMAAKSKEFQLRGSSAKHLARYVDRDADGKAKETLKTLVTDSDAAVASTAWYSAAEIAVPGLENDARELIDEASAPPELRLAAAYYLLKAAERADID